MCVMFTVQSDRVFQAAQFIRMEPLEESARLLYLFVQPGNLLNLKALDWSHNAAL